MTTLVERTKIAAPIERCFDLARSVEVHLAGNVHWGEAAVATGGVSSGLLEFGDAVTWQARHFGIRQKLTSKITAMNRPTFFHDAMLSGAFRCMHHDHFFRPLSPGGTEMIDIFTFSAPFGWLGKIAELFVLRRYMASLLRERNAALRQIAESTAWRNYLPQ